MNATDFCQIWKKFIIDQLNDNGNWTELWQSGQKWSDFIVGAKHSSKNDSPLGNFIANKSEYDVDPLTYRTEEDMFDLTFFKKGNNMSVSSLDMDWKLTFSEQKPNHPEFYDIILKHENQIYIAWEEMCRLAYAKSRLKVLVTYHSEKAKQLSQKQSELLMLEKNFKSIIKSVNKSCPENPKAEYLLLVGSKRAHYLDWKIRVFDIYGNITDKRTHRIVECESLSRTKLIQTLEELESQIAEAIAHSDFEQAAEIRDKIKKYEDQLAETEH